MPPPDADLYETASGPAKALADHHQAEQPLKLFAGWFCPFGLLDMPSPINAEVAETS